MKKILKDIEERQLRIVSLICETDDNELIVLGYDSNELLNYISGNVEQIKLYETNENNVGMMPICTVGKNKNNGVIV